MGNPPIIHGAMQYGIYFTEVINMMMADEETNGMKMSPTPQSPIINGESKQGRMVDPPPSSSVLSAPLSRGYSSRSDSVLGCSGDSDSIFDGGSQQNAVFPKQHEHQQHDHQNQNQHQRQRQQQQATTPRRKDPPQKSSSMLSGSSVVSEPPPGAHRGGRRGRTRASASARGRIFRHLNLMKSTSTPSLHKLETSANVAGGADRGVETGGGYGNDGGMKYSFWQREDFGRPLMAQRRSLSPRTSSASRIQFGRAPPTRLEDALFGDIDHGELTTARLDGPDRDAGVGVLATMDRLEEGRNFFSRRASMPAHLAETLLAGSKKSTHAGEVMDPKAMRYLPKILRDTYAQRQTKRQSLVSSPFWRDAEFTAAMKEACPFFRRRRMVFFVAPASSCQMTFTIG